MNLPQELDPFLKTSLKTKGVNDDFQPIKPLIC